MKTDKKKTEKKATENRSESDKQQKEVESGGTRSLGEHSWKGTWDRPVRVDEKSHSDLTIARMTDHNVRGRAESEEPETAEPAESAESSEDKKVG